MIFFSQIEAYQPGYALVWDPLGRKYLKNPNMINVILKDNLPRSYLLLTVKDMHHPDIFPCKATTELIFSSKHEQLQK